MRVQDDPANFFNATELAEDFDSKKILEFLERLKNWYRRDRRQNIRQVSAVILNTPLARLKFDSEHYYTLSDMLRTLCGDNDSEVRFFGAQALGKAMMHLDSECLQMILENPLKYISRELFMTEFHFCGKITNLEKKLLNVL